MSQQPQKPKQQTFEGSSTDPGTSPRTMERRVTRPPASPFDSLTTTTTTMADMQPHRSQQQQQQQQQQGNQPRAALGLGGRGGRSGGVLGRTPNPTVYFDPYSPVKVKVSLLDAEDVEEEEEAKSRQKVINSTTGTKNPCATPGTAGFLEMEQPDGDDHDDDDGDGDDGGEEEEEEEIVFEDEDDFYAESKGADPIQTDSGLLLTHRKTPQEMAAAAARRSSTSSSSSAAAAAAAASSSFRVRSRHASSSHHHQQQNQQQQQHRLELDAEDESWYPNPYRYSPGQVNNTNFSAGSSTSTPPPRGSAQFYQQQYWNHYYKSTSLQRWLSYARLWVVVSVLLLVTGTVVLLQHIRHEGKGQQDTSSSSSAATTTSSSSSSSGRVVTLQDTTTSTNDAVIPDRIVLLPLPLDSALPPASLSDNHNNKQQQHNNNNHNHHSHNNNNNNNNHRHLLDRHPQHPNHNHDKHTTTTTTTNPLHDLFVQWKSEHGRHYDSHHEHHKRFHIWKENHQRIQRKNELHGPCKLTGQPVFGLNHLSDLTEEEFQQQFLSGYGAPPRSRDATLPVLDPELSKTPFLFHEKIQQSSSSSSSSSNDLQNRRNTRRKLQQYNSSPARQTSWESCDWYDISCFLRYIFETYFYGLGRTMEPMYDADSYPMAVDWRQVGAVTNVHSQGSCGACWAITAVETVESAHFLSYNQLLDLAETEVVVCADECEMCSGGWPQNAFEYIMDQKGIPLETDLPYDGDYLLQLTQAKEGGDQDGDLQSYMQQICPSGGGNKGGHSGDKNNDGSSSSSSFSRYGNIKGYGYATEKCVCYTDGSGCDCDSQDEGLAVRNVATYGPAVVCVDASTWQDYKSGIMTADSGCSSKFMDVNHCVQVVGYAFSTGSDNDDGQEQEQNSRDNHGGSHDNGGSQDNENRVGYWIVRNQWSAYWGMSGYAYVAMGENTCGILNDMIQVYGE